MAVAAAAAPTAPCSTKGRPPKGAAPLQTTDNPEACPPAGSRNHGRENPAMATTERLRAGWCQVHHTAGVACRATALQGAA